MLGLRFSDPRQLGPHLGCGFRCNSSLSFPRGSVTPVSPRSVSIWFFLGPWSSFWSTVVDGHRLSPRCNIREILPYTFNLGKTGRLSLFSGAVSWTVDGERGSPGHGTVFVPHLDPETTGVPVRVVDPVGWTTRRTVGLPLKQLCPSLKSIFYRRFVFSWRRRLRVEFPLFLSSTVRPPL